MTPIGATLLLIAVIGIADMFGNTRHLIGWKLELAVCAVAAVLVLIAGTVFLMGAPN